MADKRRFNLSFSLSRREHRDAWNRLSAIPPGQRMDAICRMINGYMEQRELLKAIRRMLREELADANRTLQPAQAGTAGAVDGDVLDFLRTLQEGDGFP